MHHFLQFYENCNTSSLSIVNRIRSSDEEILNNTSGTVVNYFEPSHEENHKNAKPSDEDDNKDRLVNDLFITLDPI